MRALSMPGHNIIASKLQMSAATSFDSGNGVDLAGHQLVDNNHCASSLCYTERKVAESCQSMRPNKLRE
jgi:hypothetical protein